MALNMNDVSALAITEGDVRTIHDNNGQLLWGKLNYDTKYKGDSSQQTYTGKNLFDISKVISNAQVINNNDGTLTINAPSGSSSAPAGLPNKLSDYCPNLKVGDTATLSFDTTGNEKYIYLYGTGANILWETSTSGRTKTVTQAMLNAQVLFYASGPGTTATISNFQIELGSTPTAYEPYVGGVPAPNPDYPQDVNVVTGTQTVTVSDGSNSQAYNVRLGSLELAKIGTYQDYIYKSGDDWYVHKAINKLVFDGTQTWGGSNGKFSYVDASIVAQPLGLDEPIICLSNYFLGSNYSHVVNDLADNIIAGYYNGGQFRTRTTNWSTHTEFETWLSTHNTTVYYALATPADTKITDADLVSDLNAIHQFLTRYGYNASVSGNLPLIIDKTALS